MSGGIDIILAVREVVTNLTTTFREELMTLTFISMLHSTVYGEVCEKYKVIIP
jgi:hypothetical protein